MRRRKAVCLDTSVLIEYFRKKDKSKTLLYLLEKNYRFAVSTITEYEIYAGCTEVQEFFWYNIFKNFTLFKFDSGAAITSGMIYKQLKAENKLIESPDIFIAATAMKYNLPLATLNKKHFERIEGLKLITP
jgi:predicted nucleic acid-binding protein